ncbi:MAG: flavin reductase family protein [Clostridia bacterium]|nr:flavin reductase family protein [Clostridia bacterium]
MINENFYEIPADELGNAVRLIGMDWMLITARDGEKVNAMTASWGSLGVLWNRPVCTCFIRPQRHTYGLVEREEKISIAFLPEGYRKALSYCGSHSGRDGDKLSAAGLTSDELDGVPVIAEADTLLICRKLYFGDLSEEGFADKSLLSNYKDGDYHRFYVCEIEKAYKRR